MEDPRIIPRKHYSKLEMEYLRSIPKVQLNPAEFLAVWREEQKEKGFEETGRRKLNEDTDLYELFETNEKARKSPNQLVKAIRAEGLKCSNERSKIIFPLFEEQYKIDHPKGD